MIESPVIIIKTDKDTHFTGAIVQNAHKTESIDLTGITDAKQDRALKIGAINIQSAQNLEWDVYFWESNSFKQTDLDSDAYLFMVNFPASAQKQIVRGITWTVNTAKSLGDYVIPVTPNGYIYECTDAGTTHTATEPTWPTTIGATVTDGAVDSVTWTCRTWGHQYYIDDTVGMAYPISSDNKIHLSLCNRSATAKNAGATGNVTIKIFTQTIR